MLEKPVARLTGSLADVAVTTCAGCSTHRVAERFGPYPRGHMKYLLLLLVVFAGSLFPLQAGINARCGAALGHPLWATLANFVGGSVFAVIALAIVRPSQPNVERALAAPWWVWAGGLCGCTFVCIALVAVRPLGYLGLVSGLLVGQVLASVVFDHSGFLREQAHPMTLGRLAGVMLLAVGFWMVNRD